MAYKITGKVHIIGEMLTLASKSGSQYNKRDLVITVIKFDPYTGAPTVDVNNTPKFTFIGERCRDLDNLTIGQTVTVFFEVNGRSYEREGKTEYFTDLRPLKVELNRSQVSEPTQPFVNRFENANFVGNIPTTPSPDIQASNGSINEPQSEIDSLPF